MLGILGDNPFQQWARFGGPFGAQEALSEVCTSINVIGIALQRGAVACLGFLELALAEVNIAKLEMVMGFIEVINLRLQFFDTRAVCRARQLESTHRRCRAAVHIKIIEQGGQPPAYEYKKCPYPFLPPDCVNKHPNLECEHQQRKRRTQQVPELEQVIEQPGEHRLRLPENCRSWQCFRNVAYRL